MKNKIQNSAFFFKFFITVAGFEVFRDASSPCSFNSIATEASLQNIKSLNFPSEIRLILRHYCFSKKQLSEAFIIFSSLLFLLLLL